MNWKSNWFCIHACLEYYFWFQSRLHWFADKHVITLGGVGVFFPREVLEEVGGWDENALTEDAKIGIQCSANSFEFKILSDEHYSTKEETPLGAGSFIKQRTRWILGFLQIYDSGIWQKLKPMQQVYFLSLVLFPIFQVVLYFWAIPSILFIKDAHILLALLSYLPLSLLLFQIAIQLAGLVQMLYARKAAKYTPFAFAIFIVTFIPYQLLIGVSAIRAVTKYFVRDFSWEKTAHLNLHRGRISPNLLVDSFYDFVYSIKSWIL